MFKGLTVAFIVALGSGVVGVQADEVGGISLDPPQHSATTSTNVFDHLWGQNGSEQAAKSDQLADADTYSSTQSSNDQGEPGTTTGYRNIETERWGPQDGDWEFTLSGTGSNNDTFSTGSWGVSPSIGYYFCKNLELSLRQTANFGNSPGGSSWSGSTIGALDFVLPISRFAPFIGMGGGAFYGEHVHASWVFAPEAGLKYYLYPKTFIWGMASYQWPTDRSFENNGAFVWTLGLGLNF